MDSTPPQPPVPKLPIKRKAPLHSFPNPNPNLITKTESAGDGEPDLARSLPPKTPAVKFHRIWTEPDEIRFLQGLLDCSSQGLAFPRDLHFFYARFSDAMTQPYTKSQLSEKLRRLRKKFRVISARLARGLDPGHLSPHDRSLFDLSKRLWHPDCSSSSPFNNSFSSNCARKTKSTLVGVKVRFSPTLPLNSASASASHQTEGNGSDDKDDDMVVNLDSRNIGAQGGSGDWVGAKTVVDVFDESLKEIRMVVVSRKQGNNVMDFGKRWRQQRLEELEVFGRRLRLVLENSLSHLGDPL